MSSLPAAISRQHTGSTAHSTLAPAYERRLIRVAHGVQFNPIQLPLGWGVNEHLDSLLPSQSSSSVMASRLVWDQEVAGSSPVSVTTLVSWRNWHTRLS